MSTSPTTVSIGSSRSFVISCHTCVARDSSACADCVVTHVLALEPDPIDAAVVAFDDAEWAAVDLLVSAGLVPTLRHHEASDHPSRGGRSVRR
jgi:hypothetical protein